MTEGNTETSAETRRQAYLAAMGVTAYFPRLVLPGAPSPRVQMAPVTDAVAHEPQDSGVMTLPKTALEALLEKAEVEERDWREPWPEQLSREQEAHPEITEIPDLSSPSVATATLPPSTAPSSAAALTQAVDSMQASAQQRELRFRLALIPVSPGLSVIEQLPWLGNGQLPATHLRLLWRVLQSLGLSVTPEQLSPLPFQWPILSGGGFDKSASAARDALRSFVEEHIPATSDGTRSGQEHCLLILGEALAQELFGTHQDQPLATGTRLPLPEQWQALVTVSLDQVLRMPALKSTLWRDLRPLR